MNDTATPDDVVEQLQQFGLKTYEAKCFVALSRVPQATAREISEITDVPRTRVYDATSVLETRGLVTVQHTNPQVFRAVRVTEAVDTLRRTYESQLQSIHDSLDAIEPVTLDDTADVDTEVWTLSGKEAIAARTKQLLSEADTEIRLLADGSVLDAELSAALDEATSRGVEVTISVIGDHEIADTTASAVEVVDLDAGFLSQLGFDVPAALDTEPAVGAELQPTLLSRLLLVDRQHVLLSTKTEPTAATVDEQSVIAAGETNGLVALATHLLAAGDGS